MHATQGRQAVGGPFEAVGGAGNAMRIPQRRHATGGAERRQARGRGPTNVIRHVKPNMFLSRGRGPGQQGRQAFWLLDELS